MEHFVTAEAGLCMGQMHSTALSQSTENKIETTATKQRNY